ncbi:hypothetical protein EPO15_14670 [bacterium]|nr:MAG: hypothetical protein EPO15_14670 [bacterium]
MAPFSSALRRFGALAATAALLAQTFLPAAHAWRVDAAEKTYHASVHDSGRAGSVCGGHTGDHHHHTDADCPLCPLYASARLTAVHGACAAGAPPRPSSLLNGASVVCSSADIASAPVRGPPAFLS